MTHPTPTAELEAPAVTLPRLKPGIRYLPFDGARAGDEYLLEVGDRCYVVNRCARDILLSLGAGPETLEELARIYAGRTGREIAPATLAHILDTQIPPALLSHTPEPKRRTPFVFSFPLLPERAVRPLTAVLKLLYRRPAALVILSAFVVTECLVMPRALSSFRGVFRVFTFNEFFLFYSVIVGSMFLHELGHASACRHYECPHGPIGFGVYLIFPSFYTDVTKAWRLPRLHRTVVNLGGLYFQCLIVVCAGSYAWLYGDEFWLRVVWITNFMMLHTLNPMLKQDGYWVLSDLSGLRNLHAQVRETAARYFGGAKQSAPRAATRNDRLRLRVLYLYMLLVGGYCLYFAHFVYQATWEVALYYPATVSIFVPPLRAAWAGGRGPDFLLTLLRLLWESLLPLLLLTLLASIFYRVVRRILRRPTTDEAGRRGHALQTEPSK